MWMVLFVNAFVRIGVWRIEWHSAVWPDSLQLPTIDLMSNSVNLSLV